jgi:hypothetical protein
VSLFNAIRFGKSEYVWHQSCSQATIFVCLMDASLTFLFFLFGFSSLIAQNEPTFRQKILFLSTTPQSLDTFPIIEESVVVRDFYTHQILHCVIKNDSIALKINQLDTVKSIIQYRVLPFSLKKTHTLYDSLTTQPAGENIFISTEKKLENSLENSLDAPPLLQYKGNYTRAISAGNAQNLALQSDFNLQLSGKISEEVEINATLSDNSYPLQPDGNTLKLEEFDKVFIQLKRKNAILTAGDYELGRQGGYFLNFYKKLRGVTLYQPTIAIGKGKLETRSSVAMSRGKFARQTIPVQEGNQGAYRLQGNNGERFLIVLAGTEKIYADGRPLRRGETEDYVIDYNRAEVIFTTKLLIRKELRIVIEFEYADQNYARSLYANHTTYRFGAKSKVYFNVLSEQDSKTSGGQQSLSLIEKRLLANAGDHANATFFSGIDTLTAFDNGKIMYEQHDTLVNHQIFKVLRYATNPNTTRLVAKFSEVGAGNGNYILKNSAANGRVYEWISPNVTGKKQGNYEPIVQLIAPKQQQLYTAGTQLQVTKNTVVEAEIALSNNNTNLFSALDKANDMGAATHIYIQKKYNSSTDWETAITASYDHVKANFKAFNPYRNLPFTRNWSLQNVDNQVFDENLLATSIHLYKEKIASVQYELSGFNQKKNYSGLRHDLHVLVEKNDWYARADGNFLDSKQVTENTAFFRAKWELGKAINSEKAWKIAIFNEIENNQRRDFVTDTLKKNSFDFQIYGLRFGNHVERKWHVNTEVRLRNDLFPEKNHFAKNSVAREMLWSGHGEPSKNSRLTWNFIYRNLEYTTFLASKNNQNTYLGKAEHQFSALKNAIRATHTYEIGSGQAPKVAFTYLKVRAGEGVYAWYDRNNDNVPQQDEFDVSPFRDQAEYVRIAVFTNQYVRSNNLDFHQNINIEPKLWRQNLSVLGQKSVLEKFAFQHAWHIQRKVRVAKSIEFWNPFQLGTIDTSLVSMNYNMRSTLFFNRNHPIFENSIGLVDAKNRFIATQGFEQISATEHFSAFRWQIWSAARLEMRAAYMQNSNTSEFFLSRNYALKGYKIEPQLVVQPNATLRFATIYKYIQQKNTLKNTDAHAAQHSFSGELTYSFAKNHDITVMPAILRMQLTYTSIKFEGAANTPVGFALLQGLQNGNNFLWSIGLDRSIQQNMQVSVGYEGRKMGESRIVHVARAQIRATL